MIGFYINTHHPVSATTEQKPCCKNQQATLYFQSLLETNADNIKKTSESTRERKWG